MSDAETQLTEAKTALATKNSVTLAQSVSPGSASRTTQETPISHCLKGGAGTVAVRFIPELAGRIEQLAESDQLDEAAKLISQLEEIIAQVKAFMANM